MVAGHCMSGALLRKAESLASSHRLNLEPVPSFNLPSGVIVCPDCQSRSVTLLGVDWKLDNGVYTLTLKFQCIPEQKDYGVRLESAVGFTTLEFVEVKA